MDRRVDRRDVLKGAAAAVLTMWTSPRILEGQQAAGSIRRLTDKLVVADGGGSNVLAFSGADGLVLVDGGAPKSGDKVMTALRDVPWKSLAPHAPDVNPIGGFLLAMPCI